MASAETLRQRRGGGGGGGGTTRADYNGGEGTGFDAGSAEEDEDDEDEYMPIGPLSLYFPDALVRALMAQEPSKEVSFIEAEQALLHSDGDLDAAAQHVHKQREGRARRRAEGDNHSFAHRELFENAAAAAAAGGGGAGAGAGHTGQQAMRWITSIASSAVLILVVVSLLIVAMVDGVIEVPQMVKDVARDIADSRRRP
jgi:hypothetical protein